MMILDEDEDFSVMKMRKMIRKKISTTTMMMKIKNIFLTIVIKTMMMMIL